MQAGPSLDNIIDPVVLRSKGKGRNELPPLQQNPSAVPIPPSQPQLQSQPQSSQFNSQSQSQPQQQPTSFQQAQQREFQSWGGQLGASVPITPGMFSSNVALPIAQTLTQPQITINRTPQFLPPNSSRNQQQQQHQLQQQQQQQQQQAQQMIVPQKFQQGAPFQQQQPPYGFTTPQFQGFNPQPNQGSIPMQTPSGFQPMLQATALQNQTSYFQPQMGTQRSHTSLGQAQGRSNTMDQTFGISSGVEMVNYLQLSTEPELLREQTQRPEILEEAKQEELKDEPSQGVDNPAGGDAPPGGGSGSGRPPETSAAVVDTTKGKQLKHREGRYKLGRNQFVPNKFIYIPARMMLSPSFNFAEIIPKAFGFPVPSIIFRINRAIKTQTWNFRLPQSRRYLIDVTKGIGGTTAPTVDQVERRKNVRREQEVVDLMDPKAYLKYIPGTIEHYHGVLEENCKRILRAQYQAFVQAQAVYRVHEIWSDEYDEDVVGQWVADSAPKGPFRHPIILGVADRTDFSDDVWSKFKENCYPDYEQLVKDNAGSEPEPFVIDPKPYYTREIPIEYDPRTGHPTKSIPHPHLTHLIVSENRTLLEQKLIEVVSWGVILINGGIKDCENAILAVQLGLPLVCYKYTGGAADVVIEMIEKVDKWVMAKRAQELNVQDVPPRPFPDDMCPGYHHNSWLMPFDEKYVFKCNMLNVLVENWPDRHDKASVFIIDMFITTEDDVQDRITQTIAVVFAGDYELGGSSAEEKRLSYAMRIRHKFIYNAAVFKFVSDILTIAMIVFTSLSTFASVVYGILVAYPEYLGSQYDFGIDWLVRISLLLPLVATVLRGIIATISPYMKYVALKNASVLVEGEVYAFRCKVGKYSVLKTADDDDEEGDKKKKGKKGKKKKKKKKKKEESEEKDGKDGDKGAGGPNPRKAFSQAIDQIWVKLAASDLTNGSLRVPRSTSPAAALEDINSRIKSNRATQDAYSVPMLYGGGNDGPADSSNDDEDASDGKKGGCCDWLCKKKEAHDYSAVSDLNYSLDDGITLMTPDDYVCIRVNPMAAYYAAKSPSLHVGYCVAAVLSNLLSITACVLAGFAQVPYIPAVNAIGEALTAWVNYRQLELRLLQTNLAMNQLNQILVWWDSLTVIERRVPANVENLVKKTEAAIRAQATIFQGGGGGGGEGNKEGEEKDD